jgi:hypothetical protein
MTGKALVYTAQSKQYFYCRDAVCEFVFDRNHIPINPFRVFDYFLGDRVERNAIRAANAEILSRCDEVWVFGERLADGVLIEIAQAEAEKKPIRYFSINNDAELIRELNPDCLSFENEVLAGTGLAYKATPRSDASRSRIRPRFCVGASPSCDCLSVPSISTSWIAS